MQLMSGRLYGGGARGAFDHIVEEVRKARRSEGPGSSSFASAAAAASAAEFAGAGATSASSTAAPPASPTTATARVLGPFTGSWELDHTLDHEQADRLEALRQELGEPWLLRRMIRYMEERFSVEQTAEHMTVRMRRKLLSSGVMTLELDGAEHEWGMSLPMFQGLSRQWKYRAWIDDVGRVHHVHDVGVTDRMRRVLELVDGASRMKISAVLERWDGSAWVRRAEATQMARRVVGEEEDDAMAMAAAAAAAAAAATSSSLSGLRGAGVTHGGGGGLELEELPLMPESPVFGSSSSAGAVAAGQHLHLHHHHHHHPDDVGEPLDA